MSKQAQTANDEKKHVIRVKSKPEQERETAVINPIPSLQRTYADPRALSPADAHLMQRTIGNQALGRLIIQRKMTVGPVGDKYEQEADAVAKQVVNKLHTSPAKSSPAQTAQRQEEEGELQMKPLPSISSLQRQEEEELQANRDPMLSGGELSDDVENSVQSAKSGGQPLADNIRTPMEQAFNADFSGVKVHTGNQANTLNRSLSARAFTSGQDVFFRTGEYNPENSSGQELLAHELTHVMQQNTGTVQRYAVVGVNQSEDRAAYSVDDDTDESTLFKSQSIEQESWERNRHNARGQVTERKKTYKSSFKEKYANQPPLRVAHQGKMAIEHTEAEPKVFFAANDVVAASNERLQDIDSPVRLGRATGTVNVPVEPTNPDSDTVAIGAVTPTSPTGAQVDMGGSHECNVFAQGVTKSLSKIVLQEHGSEAKHTANFNLNDEPEVGTPNQHMVATGAIQGDSAEELAARMNAGAPVKQTLEQVLATLPQDVQDAHANGNISKGWVEDLGTGSDDARTEVIAELRRRRFDFPRLEMNRVLMRHRTLPTAKQYGRMQRYNPDQDDALGNQRSKALGINEYAAPEVGEAYVTARVKAQALTFDNPGEIDFREGDAQSDQLLDQRLQEARNQADAMLKVSLRGLDVAKRGWTWHAAAVIARTGADSVTFENYNRDTGGKWELEELYQTMYAELSQFLNWHPIARDRLKKLTDVRQQITRLAQHANQWSTAIQSFEVDTQDVFADKSGRWYFQMYGPAQGPDGDDQSFHGVWKKENVNATTVRVGAGASDQAKLSSKGKLDTLADERRVQVDGIDEEALVSALAAAKLEIDGANTLAEMSERYREGEKQIKAIGTQVERIQKERLRDDAYKARSTNFWPTV